MNTERCELLLKILERGSLAQAAEEMGYSASAVSRSVEAMEEEAGFRILNRSRRGIALTKEGELLLPAVREIAEAGKHYEDAVFRIKGIESGSVVIGTAYAGYYPMIAGIVRSFSEKHPRIRVSILDSTSSDIAERIENGKADLGIISYRKEYAGRNSARWHTLIRDRLVAAVAKTDPLAKKKRITDEELRSRPYIEMHPGIESDNSRYFEKKGFRPDTAYTANDCLALYFMVKAGLGIGMLNEIIARELPDDIAYIPLKNAEKLDIGLLFPDERTASPAAKIFRRFVMEHIQTLSPFS